MIPACSSRDDSDVRFWSTENVFAVASASSVDFSTSKPFSVDESSIKRTFQGLKNGRGWGWSFQGATFIFRNVVGDDVVRRHYSEILWKKSMFFAGHKFFCRRRIVLNRPLRSLFRKSSIVFLLEFSLIFQQQQNIKMKPAGREVLSIISSAYPNSFGFPEPKHI